MNKILITGSEGLLSSNIISKLIKTKNELFVTSRCDKKSSHHNLKFINIDFSKDWSDNILPKQIDIVIHLAQSDKFRDFPNMASDIFKVNIESTAKLLNYGRKISIKKFIYTSSGGVYAKNKDAFKENYPIISPGNLGFYLGSKASSEILVQSYSSIFNVVIFRPFFMYGKKQKKQMLMPRLMSNIIHNKKIKLNGQNGIKINPIHVDDASEAVINSIEKISKSILINIAGPQILSIREICNEMSNFLKKDPLFIVENNLGKDVIGDISLMKDLLNSPTKTVKNSLEDIFCATKNLS